MKGGQQQSHAEDGGLAILFLTASFVGQRNQPRRPMSNFDAGLNLVPMLTARPAGPRPMNVAVLEKSIGVAARWMWMHVRMRDTIVWCL